MVERLFDFGDHNQFRALVVGPGDPLRLREDLESLLYEIDRALDTFHTVALKTPHGKVVVARRPPGDLEAVRPGPEGVLE